MDTLYVTSISIIIAQIILAAIRHRNSWKINVKNSKHFELVYKPSFEPNKDEEQRILNQGYISGQHFLAQTVTPIEDYVMMLADTIDNITLVLQAQGMSIHIQGENKIIDTTFLRCTIFIYCMDPELGYIKAKKTFYYCNVAELIETIKQKKLHLLITPFSNWTLFLSYIQHLIRRPIFNAEVIEPEENSTLLPGQTIYQLKLPLPERYNTLLGRLTDYHKYILRYEVFPEIERILFLNGRKELIALTMFFEADILQKVQIQSAKSDGTVETEEPLNVIQPEINQTIISTIDNFIHKSQPSPEVINNINIIIEFPETKNLTYKDKAQYLSQTFIDNFRPVVVGYDLNEVVRIYCAVQPVALHNFLLNNIFTVEQLFGAKITYFGLEEFDYTNTKTVYQKIKHGQNTNSGSVVNVSIFIKLVNYIIIASLLLFSGVAGILIAQNTYNNIIMSVLLATLFGLAIVTYLGMKTQKVVWQVIAFSVYIVLSILTLSYSDSREDVILPLIYTLVHIVLFFLAIKKQKVLNKKM